MYNYRRVGNEVTKMRPLASESLSTFCISITVERIYVEFDNKRLY